MKENVTIGDIRDFKLRGGESLSGIVVENNYTMATLKIAGSNGFREIAYGDIESLKRGVVEAVQREALEKVYKYYRMHKKLTDKRNEIELKLGQLERAIKGNIARVQIEDREYTVSEFALTFARVLNKETGGELKGKGYGVKSTKTSEGFTKIYIYRNKPLNGEVAFYINSLEADIETTGAKASRENLERAISLLGEDNFKYYSRHGVDGVSIKESCELKEGVFRHLIEIEVKEGNLRRGLIKSIVNGMLLVKK